MCTDLRIVAVAEPDAAVLTQVKAPGARLVHDWRELVDDDAIEVLHVATPPYLRSDVIESAFAAGKSIFCEKPLALSLREADRMIQDAERRKVTLGVNYVMRHLPAYHLLDKLATSGLLGLARSVSFHNFAQHVPLDHWFWDERRSGGILVEHGVHFFDAYSRVAGRASEVWADAPRRESVDVRVLYAGGAVGRFYHEFDFPREVENAAGITMFERGYVTIEGWIPTRLTGAALAPREDLLALGGATDISVIGEHGPAHFSVGYPDREGSYRAAIVAGMRDVIRRHRDPAYEMVVTARDARESLALALAARDAIRRGGPVWIGE